MKKGCLFDLDGTLVNSIKDLALSTNAVLKMHGLKNYDIDDYQMMVGNGVKKLVERALTNKHSDLLETCLEEFYEYYDEHCLDYTDAYDGIYEMLQSLKARGIKMAVVTNKPHYLAVKIVEHLFPDTFIAIYGQQDLYPIKPHPESTYLALMALRLSKDECFFIGDSHVDMETGQQAQMETIGVEWGFRGYEELKQAEATYIISDPKEIIRIFDDENRN